MADQEVKMSEYDNNLCILLENLSDFHEDMEDMNTVQTLHRAIVRIQESVLQAEKDEIKIRHLESYIEKIFTITQGIALDYLKLYDISDDLSETLIELNDTIDLSLYPSFKNYISFVTDRQELFNYLPHFLNNELA